MCCDSGIFIPSPAQTFKEFRIQILEKGGGGSVTDPVGSEPFRSDTNPINCPDPCKGHKTRQKSNKLKRYFLIKQNKQISIQPLGPVPDTVITQTTKHQC